MRLINAETLEVREFIGNHIPEYTILSHTWDLDEVTFRDMQGDLQHAKRKAGFAKIEKCCLQTQQDGFRWTWVDTCCINKDSSAELTEAINSMFKWYRNAQFCYVYLQDVPSSNDDVFEKSRWFTRGWTLQELLAPRDVFFFNKDWKPIGTIAKSFTFQERDLNPAELLFVKRVAEITGIPSHTLRHLDDISESCVAQRMYGASNRETTREEDLAYCLMGLFDVNLPILYGEGLKKAFRRLQIQIMESTTDHTIFAWDWKQTGISSSIIAPSPSLFRDSINVGLIRHMPGDKPFHMTNNGLEISLPLAFMGGAQYIAALDCYSTDRNGRDLRVLLYLSLVKEARDDVTAFFVITPVGFWDLPVIECDAGIAWDSKMIEKITITNDWPTVKATPMFSKQTELTIHSGSDLLKLSRVDRSQGGT